MSWVMNSLLVTYSISALLVQTYDASCLGAFTEKGVLGSFRTAVTLLWNSFNSRFMTHLWPPVLVKIAVHIQ